MMEKSAEKYSLPQDYIPKAEVALLLGFYLLALPDSEDTAHIALDGAQVKVGANQFLT